MNNVVFDWEKLSPQLIEEVTTITIKHWNEIALDKDDVQLALDWEALITAEGKGLYKAFVARRNGKLIGYLPFNIWKPARYKNTLFIQDDVFYIISEEPNRAKLLLQMFDAALKVLPRPCKFHLRLRPQRKGDRLGEILEKRYGMKCTEITYSRMLK